ncbi:MAG: LapA family protein [Parvularculaceae bacterium]
MKKLTRWFFTVPAGALLVVFLVANRAPVALSLDPLSTTAPALATPALPLWIWLVLFLLAGVGLGAAASWTSGRELRLRAKADRLELKALRKTAPVGPTSAAAPPPKDQE